jgi:hypothetical protein
VKVRIVDGEVITSYLLRLGYRDFIRPERDRWVVGLRNPGSEPKEFTVEIYLRGPWVGFISPFFYNLEGDRLGDFYELIHRLNHFLDLFKFGISEDGRSITLQVEWSRADMDFVHFKGILHQFARIYAKCWFPLVKEAHDLGLTERERESPWVDRTARKLIGSGSK